MEIEKSSVETEGSVTNHGKWIDRIWKNVLADLFDEAVDFFMPDLAAARDYAQQAVLLNEEQPAIGAGDDRGMRVPDMIASVPLKGGGEQ